MATHFLGKHIPKLAAPPAPPVRVPAKRSRTRFLGFAAGALMLAGFSMTVQLPVATSDPTVLANAASFIPQLPVEEAHAATYDPNGCNTVTLNAGTSVLPLIPTFINNDTCNPTNWNLRVVWYLGNKALLILNWFAGVAAVILTMYAGLLYLSGFANEGNIKTAKTLLVAVYSGLIIVFAARFIVLGAAQLAGNQKTTTITTDLTK